MGLRQDLIQRIIDRAAGDPDFVQRLMEDPEGTASDEDLDLTEDEITILPHELVSLGIVGEEDAGLVERLEPRLSHVSIPGEAGHVPHLHEEEEEE